VRHILNVSGIVDLVKASNSSHLREFRQGPVNPSIAGGQPAMALRRNPCVEFLNCVNRGCGRKNGGGGQRLNQNATGSAMRRQALPQLVLPSTTGWG
jgi:hypothetical protein